MIIQGCKNSHLVEDGYCNDETNKIQCAFDGGDCCYACVNKAFCKDCLCLTGTFEEVINPLIMDGYCHDETNNPECGYDGGDCCGSCVITDYCTNCSCIGNVTGNGVPNALVGDGYCNDETNNAACNYDHGECCLSNMNTDYCSNCSCSSIGVITSPGFPSNYVNNLDLTWIIQLPLGQYIKIGFVNFDVEFDSTW